MAPPVLRAAKESALPNVTVCAAATDGASATVINKTLATANPTHRSGDFLISISNPNFDVNVDYRELNILIRILGNLNQI